MGDKMKYVLQLKENDCGFTCLKNLFYRVTKDEKYLILGENLNEESYSFLDMKRIAFEHGFILNGYQSDYEHLQKKDIVLTQNKMASHYLLIIDITKSKIKLLDPSYGIILLSRDKFNEIFTERILRLEKHKLKEIKENVTLYKLPLSIIIILYLEAMTIIIALALFENIFCFISLILAFILQEIIKRRLLYKAMNKIDKMMIVPHLEKVSKDELPKLLMIKKNLLIPNIMKIRTISELLIMSFMLIINDLFYLGCILIIISVAVLFNKFNNKSNQYEMKTIENIFLNGKEMRVNYHNLIEKSIKIERINFVSNIIKITLLLFIILGYSSLKDNFNLNFIIFNFGCLFYLERIIENYICLDSIQNDYLKAQSYYNSFCKTYD